MEAYSLDLRTRIVRACDEGSDTRAEIADRFDVSTSFIRRLLQRRRETQSIAPKPHRGGFPPVLREEKLDRLRQMVLDHPDVTLAELCQKLKAEGVSVCQATVCQALKRLGLVRKKRPFMPPSGIHRVSSNCARIGVSRWRRSSRRSWFFSMKAEPRRP